MKVFTCCSQHGEPEASLSEALHTSRDVRRVRTAGTAMSWPARPTSGARNYRYCRVPHWLPITVVVAAACMDCSDTLFSMRRLRTQSARLLGTAWLGVHNARNSTVLNSCADPWFQRMILTCLLL